MGKLGKISEFRLNRELEEDVDPEDGAGRW